MQFYNDIRGLCVGPLLAPYFGTMKHFIHIGIIEGSLKKRAANTHRPQRSQEDFHTEIIHLPRKTNRMWCLAFLFFAYCFFAPRFFGILDIMRMNTDEANLDAYRSVISNYSKEYNVHPALVAAMIKVESDFRADVVSPRGAQGLMQIMPATARELDVDNINDPTQNIRAGTKYIKSLLDQFGGNTKLAVAAYNAGPGAVLRAGTIPPYRETRRYVEKVLYHFRAFKKSFKA